MPSSTDEITRDIVVAIINKAGISGTKTPQETGKAIGELYKVILKAVNENR